MTDPRAGATLESYCSTCGNRISRESVDRIWSHTNPLGQVCYNLVPIAGGESTQKEKVCVNGAEKSGICATSAEDAPIAETASVMSMTETTPAKMNTTEFPEPIPEERAGREVTEDDIELELSHAVRLELFISHPCSGKYGDDGEMQCNRTPFIDFKRDFPSEILAKSMIHRLLLAAQPSVQRISNDWIEIKEGCEVPERGDTVTLLCEPKLGRDHAYQEINETCFTMGWEEMRACGVAHWKPLDWPITAERGSK